MKSVGALLLTLGILISTSFSASIGLVQELTFDIPMLQGEVIDFTFNDVDDDGYPEVLACDKSVWVLYSIQLDSILYWGSLRDSTATSDTAFNSTNVRLLLEDVNLDSVNDIAVCTYLTEDPFGSSTTEVELKVYDGKTSYQNHSSIYLDAGDCFFKCQERRMGTFATIDIDCDKIKELVVSFHALVSTPWDESTFGMVYIFDPFPDSLISRRYFIPEINTVDDANDWPPVIENYNYSYTRVVGEYTSKFELFGRFDSLFYFKEYQSTPSPQISISSSTNYTGSFLLWGCSGNIETNDTTSEFVCLRTLENIYGSVSDLGLYKIVSQNTISTIWNFANVTEVYDNFMYHPLFPGFFFAFVDNVFTQFRGEDGSIFQITTDVPSGKREWNYPFIDSIPRLIVRNGTSISIFNADVSTPVHENQLLILPSTFKLSHPYPNPFNPEVHLTLFVPSKIFLTVEVFNMLGSRVDILHDGVVSSGELKLKWNADKNPSGVYLFRATNGEYVETVKAILLK